MHGVMPADWSLIVLAKWIIPMFMDIPVLLACWMAWRFACLKVGWLADRPLLCLFSCSLATGFHARWLASALTGILVRFLSCLLASLLVGFHAFVLAHFLNHLPAGCFQETFALIHTSLMTKSVKVFCDASHVYRNSFVSKNFIFIDLLLTFINRSVTFV